MPRLGMSKRKLRRSRPGTEGILPFRVDPDPIDSAVTSFSGLPLVAEAFRSLGLDASCRTHLALKQRERGFTEAQMVESFALGLGTMPCGRFGADAAWSRLNVITYNLLQVVKRVALPKAQRKARPKRLRYEIFRQAGIIIHHARTTVLRLAADRPTCTRQEAPGGPAGSLSPDRGLCVGLARRPIFD